MQDLPERPRANQGLPSDAYWYLVGFVDKNQKQWRTIIRSLPLKIGRHASADLYLYSTSVSHEHAELFQQDGALWIRDLDSTNGTFVNSVPISEPVMLRDGDTVHFADLVFRLGAYQPPRETDQGDTLKLDTEELAARLREYSGDFTSLMREEAVRPYFQGLYRIAQTDDVLGYELLSRGLLGGLETLPLELFYIAERLGQERELSQLCRKVGGKAALELPGSPICFMNTHPAELQQPRRFLESVDELRQDLPDLRLTIEIHEAAITGSRRIGKIRDGLRDMGVQLAYDDFGTGQSRLREIAEVPPDYLKFDMSLIRDLDRSPDERQQFVAGLVNTARSIGIVPIAEGIESRPEADACARAGFEYAQGYYFSLPAPLSERLSGATEA